MDPAYDGRPASAVLLPWRRNAQDPLAGLKTLNYAANRMGRAWAAERGADEGLWRNARGHLTEGCSSNLFVVEGRKLFTAAVADGILPGIVRGQVLGSARDLGVAIHEGKLRLRRLERAREAFLTSSLGGVRPLVRYAGRVLGSGEAGPLTRKLAERVALARTGGAAPRT
jgi:branched-subunit amino acid aminotransferase/4-amino-4-deoxychorismate lyase